VKSITYSDYMHSWRPSTAPCLKNVRVEDDTRDALQAARAYRPSIDERKELLELTAKIGVQLSFLGFPAASLREREDCAALVGHISSRKLPITPILMSRAVAEDLLPIIEIQHKSQVPILVDLYICTSPLRLRIEDWDLDILLDRVRNIAKLASENHLRFRIAFEDSSRTPPEMLAKAVAVAMECEPECLVLNDTVGDCSPEATTLITRFVADLLQAKPHIELAWHGHNDRGLALANALAAAEAGATIISGTFMGIGERSGNIPLEQLIYLLVDAGNSMYDLHYLSPMCNLFAKSLRLDCPVNLPIVGEQAFETSTGTHAAAIMKARKLGVKFEDYVFSSVDAHCLGRQQAIAIGPNSGRSSIKFVFDDLLIPYSEDLISTMLNHCKEQNVCISNPTQIAAIVQSFTNKVV